MTQCEKPKSSEEAMRIGQHDLAEKYGITFSNVADGFACGELELKPMLRNFYGVPYGGVMYHLADNTAGMAFLSMGGNGVTVNGSVNYLRGAKPEAKKLICRASVKKSGRKLFFVSAEVLDDFENLLSEYMFVFTNLTTGE